MIPSLPPVRVASPAPVVRRAESFGAQAEPVDRLWLSGSGQPATGAATDPPAAQAPTASTAELAASTRAYPRRIIIIRHGEKQTDGPGLSAQGQQRADGLARALPARYPDIDYLFATAASPHSDREILTLTPLARKLGMPIHHSYSDEQFGKLAQSLLHNSRYAGKTIVVCWHHGKIPELTRALGATPPVEHWPSSCFNRIWEIDYGPGGKTSLKNLPEDALQGASAR